MLETNNFGYKDSKLTLNSTKPLAKFLHLAFSLVFIGFFLEVNVDIL